MQCNTLHCLVSVAVQQTVQQAVLAVAAQQAVKAVQQVVVAIVAAVVRYHGGPGHGSCSLH